MELYDALKDYTKNVLNGDIVIHDSITPFKISSMLMRDVYYGEKINKKMVNLAERYKWGDMKWNFF